MFKRDIRKKRAKKEGNKEGLIRHASVHRSGLVSAISIAFLFALLNPLSAAADDFQIKFDHVGISVPDMNAAIKWYHDVLEFDVEREGTLPWVPAKVVHMRRGDLRVELFQVEGFTPLPTERRFPNRDLITNGTKHVSFQVQDVKEATRILRARGADIAFEYENRAVFIRDNSGNLIEFVIARP